MDIRDASDIAGLGARDSSISGLSKDNKPEEPLAEFEGPGIMRPRAGETEVEEAGYEGEYVASEEGPTI
jgi:hypothetical protein